ncbi:hypothetical protein ABZY42_12265 [Streptomyces sp. NPDC006622]
MTVARTAPQALQLTVPVLAAHTRAEAGRAEADHLTRLCGLSQTQL